MVSALRAADVGRRIRSLGGWPGHGAEVAASSSTGAADPRDRASWIALVRIPPGRDRVPRRPSPGCRERWPLSAAEMEDLVAFGEVLVEGRTLSPAERRYLVEHIAGPDERASPEYLALYRTTVELLDRLAGRRFASLDIGERIALIVAPSPGCRRTGRATRTSGRSPTKLRVVRTRVVPDLIGGYYGSPAGWAVVGYDSFPGRCGDLTRYTRPGGLAPGGRARRTSMDAEVCIVGAGRPAASWRCELARRGVRVVVLESGPRHDFARRGEYVRRYLRHENPWRTPLPELDRHTAGGPRSVPPGGQARAGGRRAARCTGRATRFRLHADDFRLRSLHGIADDWPISYADLEPYYARAEQALGVAGAADDPWASPRSTPFPLPAVPVQLLRRAVRAGVPRARDRAPSPAPGAELGRLRRAARSAAPARRARSARPAPRPASTSRTSRRPRRPATRAILAGGDRPQARDRRLRTR